MKKSSITLYSLSGLAAVSFSTAVLAKPPSRDDDYGPLKTYAQSPIQSNSLTPLMRSGFSYAPGTVELYTTATIASVWAHTEEYNADYYQNALSIGGLWQINEKWLVELDYTWRFTANNHLDNVTTSFHDFFGIGQNGRDEVEDHSFDLSVPEYGIELHDFNNETLGNAFTFYTSYQLLETPRHGLSIGGAIYYNYVPSGPFETSNFEQALQLNYSYRRNRHAFYSMLGLSYRKNDHVLVDIPYNTVALAAGIGYQYQLTAKHRLLTEYHIYEGATDAASDLSEPSHEILLGYRYHFPHSAIEFSVVENVFNMDNSTDIAFTLGYRYRF
ncbi:DUF3187 family protein [Photobacterium atrarenae]|uniref:DUF3187 family protein n=1 Tax=Photobacterium atrarenae TaxID=865757 RepID=A0ABY5GJJ2_9GAMM|nr:DUF3187 family protein [Photobacterium atrarenae]UTV29480.1 DUF3187 family protein [Photobacterium atrarenae]